MDNMKYTNGESTPLKMYVDVEENPKGKFDTTIAKKQHKKDLLLMVTGIVIGVLGVLGVAGLSNTITSSSTSSDLEKLKAEILDLNKESSCVTSSKCGDVAPVTIGGVKQCNFGGTMTPVCKDGPSTPPPETVAPSPDIEAPPTYCTEDQEKGKLTCDGPGEESCAALYTNSSALCVPLAVCPVGQHEENPAPSWWKICMKHFEGTDVAPDAKCGTCKKPDSKDKPCECAGLDNVACAESNHYPGYSPVTSSTCASKPCSSKKAAEVGDCVPNSFGSYCAEKGDGTCGMKSCPDGTTFSDYSKNAPSFIDCAPDPFYKTKTKCPAHGICPTFRNAGSTGFPWILKDPKVPRVINKYCDILCQCGIKGDGRYGPPSCTFVFNKHDSGQKQSSDDGKGLLESCYCDREATTDSPWGDGVLAGIAFDHDKFDDCGQYLPLYGPNVGGGQAASYEQYAKTNGLTDLFPKPKPKCVKDKSKPEKEE